MNYISTRGQAPLAGFEEVLLTGLAPDGGLYVPEAWPALTADDIADFRNRPYAEVAARIIALFTGEAFSQAQLLDIAGAVYGRFDHADVAPLTKVGAEDWILELYHGPTLAFKDFAMQFLGRLFDEVLARRGERLTIIAATSGDTGAAAIDALKSCAHVDVVVLHPEGRVTDVQRRMMTCVDAANVQNIAVAGSFDDCQAIVKELFADRAFVSQVRLGGVNSINWARIAAQTVYYFTAAAAVAETGEGVSFVVPTGNFGDIFAGYVAKKIGLNINRLAVATNANDILHRAMTSGDYAPAGVAPTLSPSMDIQVASNFERLLFEVMGRDADALRVKMDGFKRDGAMRLSAGEREAISADFLSYATSEDETIAELNRHFEATGALIDPHTAVARVAAQALRQQGALSGKVVTLSTAHPAKFPDAVMQATGTTPKLPLAHRDLFDRPEVMTNAANNTDAIKQAILASIEQKA
ncbi:MAG: threonine synthase [Alphaproteobacteria bacterium]|nr:threonine synthase [Alphaproteobacteria bacterium]